jgi:pyruvate kinase
MRRNRSTKICATLGPASSTRDMIEKLFVQGVDIFRFNFSHGTHEMHKANFEHVRWVSEKYRRPIAILQDLQGPKLRIGTFEQEEITLNTGQKFRLDLHKAAGTTQRVCLPHPEIFAALQPETTLLLDDGRIRLQVQSCGPDYAETVVQIGGKLSNRKGVNVPDVTLNISSLTPKDRIDLAFGLELGVDWVALSFVQRPEDIIEARNLIQDRAKIMSKLEKPQAIQQLLPIVDLSDAIMIARGDLGVEMPPEDVPSIQRRIIRACRTVGKPVVVATQMLDSMVQSPIPTRAETSDVATAVYEGVDAVMLSAESASGKYPIEAVQMMNRIIERVERDPLYQQDLEKDRVDHHSDPSDAISAAARQVAHMISASAIVSLSGKGRTAFRTAYERPMTPIVALTPDQKTANQLALAWGCYALTIPEMSSLAEVIEQTNKVVIAEGFAKKGDHVVITAGAQFLNFAAQSLFRSGTTRMLRILTIGEES